MNLFNVLAFFAISFSVSVVASPLLKEVEKDSFFAVRSIDGDGKTINGVHYSIHDFAAQASEEACQAAVTKCQAVTNESCQVVYQKDTLGHTGVLWAPADFLCVAKSQSQISQMKQDQTEEQGLFDHVLKHWNEFQFHAVRFFDPLYQAGGFRPLPDKGN